MRFFVIGLSLTFLFMGCGQEGSLTSATDTGGGSGGSSSVSLTGTVATPRTTSKSVSLTAKGSDDSASENGSLSLSKSAGGSAAKSDQGESTKLIVSKATTKKTDGDGTVTIQKLDGTVLDTCLARSGALLGCDVNASSLDSTSLVEIVATVDSKKVSKIVDLSGTSNGQTKSSGETNEESSVANVLLYTSCDTNAHPDNKTGNFKSCVSDGTIKAETYKAIEKQLGLTSTAGTDDVQGSMAAIKKAIAAGLAEGKISGFAEMAKAVTGDSGTLATLKALDSDLSVIDMGTAATTCLKGAGGVFNMLKDSTTAAKWKGDDALLSLAKTFGKQASAEAESCITNPANCRSVYNKYADSFAAGSATAFDQMINGAKAFGKYMEKFGSTEMTAGQATAAKALFDQMSFGSKAASLHDDLGASIFNQIKSANSTAELNNITENPAAFAGPIFSDPFSLACAACDTVAQGRFDYFGSAATFTGFTPCQTDTDCSGSQTCSTVMRFCVASASGTGDRSGKLGAACSAGNDCESNTCTSSICVNPSGFTVGLKFCGLACSASADCASSSCSGGTCACTTVAGESCSTNAGCVSGYCGGVTGNRTCKALASGALADICTTGNQCSGGTCTSGTCRLVYLWVTQGAGHTCDPMEISLNQATSTSGTITINGDTNCSATISGGSITNLPCLNQAFTGTFSTSSISLDSSGCNIRMAQ